MDVRDHDRAPSLLNPDSEQAGSRSCVGRDRTDGRRDPDQVAAARLGRSGHLIAAAMSAAPFRPFHKPAPGCTARPRCWRSRRTAISSSYPIEQTPTSGCICNSTPTTDAHPIPAAIPSPARAVVLARANAALSELVRSGSQRQPEPGARVLGGAAARVLAGRPRRSQHDARPGMRLVAVALVSCEEVRRREGSSGPSSRRVDPDRSNFGGSLTLGPDRGARGWRARRRFSLPRLRLRHACAPRRQPRSRRPSN